MSFLKKKWFWFLVIIGIGGYIWYSRSHENASLFVTTPVVRGDVSHTVSASSTLLADQEINLNFEVAGRLKSIDTEVGAKVSQGDTLAAIGSVSLNEEVTKAQVALEKARADAGVNDDVLREAREAQKDAKNYLNDVQDAEDQKVDAADKAYDNATDYETAAQSYYNQVVSDDGVGSATAKSANLTLISATNAKKAAQEAKDTARRNRDVAVRLAQNSYNSQKEKVDSLESNHQDVIENSAIVIAKSNYDIAINNLEKAYVKAPVNGIITQLNYDNGEVIGSANTQPFGRLLSSDLILEAKVPESDIAQVKLEQNASVTFDALSSDEKFDATVVEIDPESTVIQDVVYYKIKLRLTNIDQRLKPGMSGDIDVHIAEKKNVLNVPSRAIKQDGNTRYVEIANTDGQTTTRKEVKIGIEGNDGQTEIISGVNEGDAVVVEKSSK